MRMTRLALLIISLFCILFSINLYAAPKKNLWPRWQAHNSQSTAVINHQAFDKFLSKYVITSSSGLNLVSYSKVSSQDRAKLDSYLKYLSQINIDNYNRDEQLAYWINLYNALTIKTVLDNYPVKSILNIKLSGFFTSGPWNAKLITVEDQPLTLNDIEHRIIRPIWNDPRTHYALNCASYGCPNLRKQAYTSQNINMTLNQAAIDYINSPRGVNIKNNQLTVSSIYDWYQVDFGNNDKAVITHLKKYAKPSLKNKLGSYHDISHYDYNWSLNGV